MKRRHYILLVGVIVLTIVVLKLPGRTATQFKLAIGSLFLPLFGLSTSAQQVAERAGNAVVPRRELLRQNDQLHRENIELLMQVQRLAEFGRENERLRAMLGFQKALAWKTRAARVVARDPANWWRNIRIDLGKRDGMQPDFPVLSPEGLLVGRISEVSDNFARVVLIGDANCRVSASVLGLQQGTRGRPRYEKVDDGVITTGTSALDENTVELAFLQKASLVKPGDVVVTSGLGGIFPKDIRIGQVIDTRAGEFGLNPVARVKLGAKLNLLDEVWVLLP